MIQKQLKVIIIGILVIFVLVLLNFLVLNPLLVKWGIIEDDSEEIKTLEGETVDQNGRILMIDKYERKDIAEVEVYNKNGQFKVINLSETFDGESYSYQYIEGAELIRLDENMKAQFFVDAGYLLSKARVAAEGIVDAEGVLGDEILADLKPFGLDPSQNPAWFRVKTVGGVVYKVIIGDKIPTTGGYYVMLEGRNAIYVLDTTLESGFLGTKYEMMNPLVATAMSSNDFFFADNFKIYEKGELFLHVQQGEIPEDSNALVNYNMLFPAPKVSAENTSAELRYSVSTNNYSEALQCFVTLVGERVVASDIDDETLAEYGFGDGFEYRVTFTYNGIDYDFIFSKKTEDNTYYVISREFYCIIEISADKVPFLEWNVIKFIESDVVDMNIDLIKSITIENYMDGRTDVFEHSGSGKELIVTGNGELLETDKYRKFYMSILYIGIKDSADDIPENPPLIATINIKLHSGLEYRYDFYFLATRNAYFTVNGEGEFYASRERILKILREVDVALANGDIIADAPE